jgi:hypothetical protein
MAGDEELDHDSQVLAQALKERRDRLSGSAAVPADDRVLSERILADARTRSAEISARRSGGGASGGARDARIPWWLWLLWVLAIAAAYLGWRLL